MSTYVDFGEKEFLVADERGYEHLLYKMAENFLFTSDGEISDSRLKLNKVSREKSINLLYCFDLRMGFDSPFMWQLYGDTKDGQM